METVTLQIGNAKAVIARKGAEMVSYRSEGKEYIWHGDPAVWAGHGPVLFPVIGMVKEGYTTIGGTRYEMPKHGLARHASFSVTMEGEDFVELTFNATEETKSHYPFDFSLHVRHMVRPHGFTTVYRIENHGEEPMPFCIGGHPAFNCPMEKHALFSDYDLVFPEKEDGENTLVNNKSLLCGKETLASLRDEGKISLDHHEFDAKDTLLLTHLQSRSVKLINRHTGRGIMLEFPKFPVLAIWSMPRANAPYVCLEPWMGLPDPAEGETKMEEKAHVAILPPGENMKVWYTMNII